MSGDACIAGDAYSCRCTWSSSMGVSCNPDSCIEFVSPYWFTSFEHLYTTVKPYFDVIFVCIFHLKNKQLNKSQQFYF
jgi:hypothetical protein